MTNANVTIRLATLGESEPVAALWAQAFPLSATAYAKEFSLAYKNPSSEILVAIVDQSIVGALIAGFDG